MWRSVGVNTKVTFVSFSKLLGATGESCVIVGGVVSIVNLLVKLVFVFDTVFGHKKPYDFPCIYDKMPLTCQGER